MSKDPDQFDPVTFLLAYDTGRISPEQTVTGFQRLIDSGDVWRLEVRYGKVAQELIDRGDCTPSPTAPSQPNQAHDVGPYVNVSKDANREVGGDEYRLILYGAYNAMGLVGSECNGIAVFSMSPKCIVTDEISIESTGYFGPSQAQLQMFDKLMTCPDAEFRRIVNASPNTRFQLENSESPRPRGPRA